MPKFEFTPTKIVLDIPDLVIDSTIIKRQIELFTMTYNQVAKTLALNWTIKHYSNNNGSVGTYLGATIPDGVKEAIADNGVTVNAQTGAIITPDVDGNFSADVAYMGQYDFFNMIAEAMPLKVHDMIRQYGSIIQW